MKNLYNQFRENLLSLNDEPVLYYQNKDYWISYNYDGWYFICGDGSNDQKFVSGEDLLCNATIDGKLLSDIFEDVIVSGGSKPLYSEIKIKLGFTGFNMDFDEITELMGLTPTKTKVFDNPVNEKYCSCSWEYVAFADEKDNCLSVEEKMYKFAELMSGKEDIINMIAKKTLKTPETTFFTMAFLMIIGDPFIGTTGFGFPLNFINFMQKTNLSVNILKPMPGVDY